MSITDADFQELDKRLKDGENKIWDSWSDEFDIDWNVSGFALDFLKETKEEAKNKTLKNLERVKEYVTKTNCIDEKEISKQLEITESDVICLLETLIEFGLLPLDAESKIKEQEELFRQHIKEAKKYIQKTGNDTSKDIAEELKISEEEAEDILSNLKSQGEIPAEDDENNPLSDLDNLEEDINQQFQELKEELEELKEEIREAIEEEKDDASWADLEDEEEDIKEKFQELKTEFEELKEEIGKTLEEDPDFPDSFDPNVFGDFFNAIKLMGSSTLKMTEEICNILGKSMEHIKSSPDEKNKEE